MRNQTRARAFESNVSRAVPGALPEMGKIMQKSLETRRVIAFAVAMLVMFFAAGTALARPGAGISAGARAPKLANGMTGISIRSTGSIGTPNRPNLEGSAGARNEVLGPIDVASIVGGIGSTLDLRPTESLTRYLLASMCLGNERAGRDVFVHVYSQSRYHTMNLSQREDLTQDTLVKLLAACSRFIGQQGDIAPNEDAIRLVAVIMKRAWIDTYRRSAKATSSISDAEDEVARIADPGLGPVEQFEMQQILQALVAAGLSKQQEAVIVLVAEGNSREEIAEQLGISQERVKEVVAEARKKLHAAVSTHGHHSANRFRTE